MTKSRRYLILTAAIMIFIFVQSALPADISGAESGLIVSFLQNVFGLSGEGLVFAVRKAAHFSEYLILGVSLCLTARYGEWIEKIGAQGELTFAGIAFSWGIGALYAVTDEFHQLFVAGRSCELRDMCIDAAGVLCGCILYGIINQCRPVKPGTGGTPGETDL